MYVTNNIYLGIDKNKGKSWWLYDNLVLPKSCFVKSTQAEGKNSLRIKSDILYKLNAWR